MTLASCSGLIVSYDRASGERLWEVDVTVDGMAENFHGEMAWVDGSLLVAPDPAEGHVYRIDAMTGDVLWRWPSIHGVSSDLLVVEERVVAVTEDNRLTLLDLESGAVLWQTAAVEGDRIAPAKPTPVVVSGDLVFGRADGRVSRHVVTYPEPLWEVWLDAAVTTDLVLFEGFVYAGSLDGSLHQVSPSGEVVGSVEIGGVPTNRWVVVPGDLLVGMTGVSGPEREVVAVDLSNLSVAWRVGSPDGFVWKTAQPALAEIDDTVVVLVGTDEPALYALDNGSGQMLWRAVTDHPPRTVSVEGDEMFIGTFGGMLNGYRW